MALLVPVFAVLYWLTIPSGTWPIVAVVKFLSVAVVAVFVVIYQRAGITVSRTSVQESGYLGLRRQIAADEIAKLLLLPIYRGLTLETETHLFAIGHDGRTLLRMRARYWSNEDIQRVADTLDVPATIISEPQTINQFRSEHPSLLFWFERRPGRRHG